MNKTKIEWVKNPDGTQGYTWNPITGCLNGCEYCYARKLANGRLKSRYLANRNISKFRNEEIDNDPFYPRFWEDRLNDFGGILQKPKGIFVCDMSDLFGIGIPEKWQEQIFTRIKLNLEHRFYLLTKQPQNLPKWSPFLENCYIGVSVTAPSQYIAALTGLSEVECGKKFISFEPLLYQVMMGEGLKNVDWVIIGAQTKPYKPPKKEWVEEIVTACDKAGIPVFLKNNLYPLLSLRDGVEKFWIIDGDKGYLRQELPKGDKWAIK